MQMQWTASKTHEVSADCCLPCTAGRHQHAGDSLTALQPAESQAQQVPTGSGSNRHSGGSPAPLPNSTTPQAAERAGQTPMRALRGIPVGGRHLPARRTLSSHEALVSAANQHTMNACQSTEASYQAILDNSALMHLHDSTMQGCNAEQRRLRESLDSQVLVRPEKGMHGRALGLHASEASGGASARGPSNPGPFQNILELMDQGSSADQPSGALNLLLGTQCGVPSPMQLHPGRLNTMGRMDITGRMPASADQATRQDAGVQQTAQQQRHLDTGLPGGPAFPSLPSAAHQAAERVHNLLDVQQIMCSDSQYPGLPGAPEFPSSTSAAHQGVEHPQNMLDDHQSMRSSSQYPSVAPASMPAWLGGPGSPRSLPDWPRTVNDLTPAWLGGPGYSRPLSDEPPTVDHFTPAWLSGPGRTRPLSYGPPTVDSVVQCLRQALQNPCDGLAGVQDQLQAVLAVLCPSGMHRTPAHMAAQPLSATTVAATTGDSSAANYVCQSKGLFPTA